MRVPHPQNGFIVFRLGIREANAFSHPPTTLSSRPKRSAVERPASLPRRHNPRGRLTQNLSSPHACAKPPKPLPPQPQSISKTWRTPPTPTTTLEEARNPTIAPPKSQQEPQIPAQPIPKEAPNLSAGPNFSWAIRQRAKRASTLPKAGVQAQPKRRNCLPSPTPTLTGAPRTSNPHIPRIFELKSLKSRFYSLKIP
jgi:hypothetical protein